MTEIEINTEPTKEVLVDSLIRDASVEACIYDLIDNSIDAARALIQQKKPDEVDEFNLPASYAGYEIKITVDKTGVTIKDNCGGMSSISVAESVLRFGQASQKEYGIGLYGVGLNRAVFKLGAKVDIKSSTDDECTIVDLYVPTYLKKKGWT